jgi:hypothetical protein
MWHPLLLVPGRQYAVIEGEMPSIREDYEFEVKP